MPFYPEDQSRENLDKIRWNNVCAECGRPLYIYGDRMRKYIACSDVSHEGIVKEYIPLDERAELKRSVAMSQETPEKRGVALEVQRRNLPMSGQLTKPQAIEVLKLSYPGVPVSEIERAAILCADFGLHPLMREVHLVPYWNKDTKQNDYTLMIGIPANRKIAHMRKGAFSYLDDTPRAATEEEIIKQFGPDSDEAKGNLISICRLKGEGGNLATGFGLWAKDSVPKGMVKGNSKRNMCNIHAERQAMDRLPGRPMPQNIEVMDEQYIETDSGMVDTKTGEIQEELETLEGDFKEVREPDEPIVDATPEPEPEVTAEEIAELAEQVNEKLEKDNAPATPAEVNILKSSYSQLGMTLLDISNMIRKDLKWPGIKKLQDLKKWQIKELLDILNKQLGKGIVH